MLNLIDILDLNTELFLLDLVESKSEWLMSSTQAASGTPVRKL